MPFPTPGDPNWYSPLLRWTVQRHKDWNRVQHYWKSYNITDAYTCLPFINPCAFLLYCFYVLFKHLYLYINSFLFLYHMRVFEYYYFIFFLVSNVDYVFTLCMYVSIYICTLFCHIYCSSIACLCRQLCILNDMFRLLRHTMICNPRSPSVVYTMRSPSVVYTMICSVHYVTVWFVTPVPIRLFIL